MRKGLFVVYALVSSFFLFGQPVAQSIDSAVIPASLLGSRVWAYASQSVINIRRAPTYQAEMTTQALLGTPMKILAKKRNWYQVQTPEGYEGWTSAPLERMDSATLHKMNKLPRVVVMDNNAFVYALSNSKEIVAEVVMGNILQLKGSKRKKGGYEVVFPDGRTGVINASAVKTWNDWKRSIRLTGESITELSKRFVGLPYFWGGTSSRGLDCSGLTKTAYFMHGIILPRDARQQYLTGVRVDSANNFSNLQKGDLLFFGKKYPDDSTRYNIVHTAIYLQNKQFIQAGDGNIQISSLDPKDSNFDNHNLNRYVMAKRIINEPTIGTWSVFLHPWYQ